MADDLRHALRRDLERAVRGEVSFDPQSRALTTMDASNYRRVPVAVVAPYDADDVAATLAVCRSHGVPVVPRGGGTSIAGQATGTGVVLDFTRHMHRIVSLSPEALTARVQPGVVLDDLRRAAAAHGLTFGPDPSTHSRCTLGGMIGNNACGAHSVAWGTTADNVRALECLTYGGEPLRTAEPLRADLRELVDGHLALLRTGYPQQLPRRISGYALDALLPERGRDLARALTGSEGTLAVITEAEVRLVPAPPVRVLVVLGYPDEGAAADAANGLLPYGPLTVEGMAADLVGGEAADLLPRGGAWLFVEMPGTGEAEALRRLADAGDSVVVTDPVAQRALWRIREEAAGTATRTPGGAEAWPGWEDCAVPPARLGAYLRDFRSLLREHGLHGTPYGHFGDGCIHVRIDFDLLGAAGVARFRRFSEDVADLVVAHGGSLSGEHGDGQARAELLPRMYGEELVALFGRFKDALDPAGGLNPGMLVRPAPSTATCASRSCRAGRSTSPSATPRTAATSQRRCAAASASPSAVTRAGVRGRASCAPRTGRRARSGTRPAAGPGCCTRCSPARSSPAAGARRRSRTPSTCACPARAAARTARSASTWPPTRRSSCTTTTGGGCGPPPTT